MGWAKGEGGFVFLIFLPIQFSYPFLTRPFSSRLKISTYNFLPSPRSLSDLAHSFRFQVTFQPARIFPARFPLLKERLIVRSLRPRLGSRVICVDAT